MIFAIIWTHLERAYLYQHERYNYYNKSTNFIIISVVVIYVVVVVVVFIAFAVNDKVTHVQTGPDTCQATAFCFISHQILPLSIKFL